MKKKRPQKKINKRTMKRNVNTQRIDDLRRLLTSGFECIIQNVFVLHEK